MAIYASIDRLNAMNKLFTSDGNKKLDRGEVDALSAFYGGLSKKSQGKVHDRLAEIYQTSKFSKGQKQRFFNQLRSEGFSVKELENLDPNTVKGFLAMPKGWQGEEMIFKADEYSRDSSMSKIKPAARALIKKELAAIEKDFLEENEFGFVGSPSVRAVYLGETESGKAKGLVGYELEVPLYTGDHDVDEAFFFNVKGDFLTSEYRGE